MLHSELRVKLDKIIEVAHASMPVAYIANAVSYASEGVIGVGYLITLSKCPHDVLANVRLWENEKFEVTSPASPGLLGEYVARVQTVMKAAHHLVCGGEAKAVEFKGDGTGLKLLEGQ
jgi:hypothetical protein